MSHQPKFWKIGVTAEQYDSASGYLEKKVSILYKRKPCQVNIGSYNTVILKLLKSNINLQFVTGVYAMLTYLISYLCKPKHTISELMKMAQNVKVLVDFRKDES